MTASSGKNQVTFMSNSVVVRPYVGPTYSALMPDLITYSALISAFKKERQGSHDPGDRPGEAGPRPRARTLSPTRPCSEASNGQLAALQQSGLEGNQLGSLPESMGHLPVSRR